MMCNGVTKGGWEVLITTYNLAVGDDRDASFFRKMNWNVNQLCFDMHSPKC